MGFFRTISGFCGFGVGLPTGLTIGYYLFIYFQPTDVKDPEVRPLVEQDSETLQRMLPEIPLWVKNPDYDRIDWLNRFIQLMWPYLDKAICNTVKNIAPPIIAEHIPKYKINAVVDLQVFASPRITLKPLVPSFPCFANIYVSLMEKPHVDFGLRLLGADIMSIPGFYRVVQENIKDQVANMYLWPKKLEIPILDPSKAMKRPVGILKVKVLRAMKLKKKDLLGASDSYVKIKLTEDKLPAKKTTVNHENLNPEWNEEFNLVVKEPESQALELRVYDWEQVGKHDRMGMNVVPLKDLTPEEPKVLTLDLLKDMDLNDAQNEKSRGQLMVELTYKPFKEDDLNKSFKDQVEQKAPEGTPAGGGLLVVTIHEAQDVEGKHHTNPHARLLFRGEEMKTKRVKNRDPRWEEEFHFTLEEPPTNKKLHVEVVSTSSGIDLLHPQESLGYVEINLSDVVSNRRINEKYHLIDSKNGRIQIELQWRPAS
ncbi:CALCIUM-DEPENDENT LIPID-BINDING (CALB DOMAIN) FAMILY PROTEIN-RELATED [Salix purpurea]|uniref:CALCIUM-DEPENDENT LIPID-BINDING (CALB DOMAIN) FAMILY PROTEIN-RELATED n=1 Tax=Salix purpurea TaxID=77065 RepID=A0A9Q0SXF9_SALPP|nr:CALCIUM-DEPENDENT LIPID-BINDING (CALB DOMAIN) FAMILY PROTEIN-RELATED [Salix purpurea]